MRPLPSLIFLASLAVSISAHSAEIRVAVAANFAQPMKEIAAEFQKDSGYQVSLTQGATGKFYAQISNGAPFDLLLSADDETPTRLVNEGKAVSTSQFTYVIGRLALWSPQVELVDQGGQVLKSDKYQHLAIANAKVAPYGRAAVQVLQKMGILLKVEPRVVQGESIAQAFQFVSSGNAQLGFVALSQVFEGGKIKPGSAWVVPESFHDQLKQDAVLLNSAKDSPAAKALLAYLRSDKATKIIQHYGYNLP
jgi:molybdate transport system substrate-binding protein